MANGTSLGKFVLDGGRFNPAIYRVPVARLYLHRSDVSPHKPLDRRRK